MMSESDAPLSMIDEAAVAAAELRRDPYDFAYVEQALPVRLKDDVLADAPRIPDRGSYGLPDLVRGPQFDAVVQDLLSTRFRHLVEEKFDTDLSRCPPCIVMMGNTSGNYNEGYAHPDSKHKIITVLLGFSREWPYERGKLRVLRSADREDCALCYVDSAAYVRKEYLRHSVSAYAKSIPLLRKVIDWAPRRLPGAR